MQGPLHDDRFVCNNRSLPDNPVSQGVLLAETQDTKGLLRAHPSDRSRRKLRGRRGGFGERPRSRETLALVPRGGYTAQSSQCCAAVSRDHNTRKASPARAFNHATTRNITFSYYLYE